MILYLFVALILLTYHYMGLTWGLIACAAAGLIHFTMNIVWIFVRAIIEGFIKRAEKALLDFHPEE